ncbi:MAG: FkbM family methyltransferase [Actinobacteria bacterium]|nr:FkbM family methyltransferase [Actinomycetota bacterium]
MEMLPGIETSRWRLLFRLAQSETLVRFTSLIFRSQVARTMSVSVSGTNVVLWSPTPRIRSRNRTIATKEPLTIKWLSEIPAGSVLWDVGANIGLYSVLAAKFGARVVAIEPSTFNVEALTRNISLNEVQEQITLVPLPISHVGRKVSRLALATMELGDSQNLFHSLKRDTGGHLTPRTTYMIPGLPLDELANLFEIPRPTHLKIDVDGNEPEIIASAGRFFDSVYEILTEIPQYAGAAQSISQKLSSDGFQLMTTSRRNQLWVRR